MDMPGVNEQVSQGISAAGDLIASPPSPLVRLWDVDWDLKHTVTAGWRIDEPGVLALPLESPVSRWLLELDHASLQSAVHLTADHADKRWQGRLDSFTITKTEGFGDRILTVRFKDQRDIDAWIADLQKNIQSFE
ncbi:Gp37-like protein [Rhodococcoides fascians]|uniref:Gp37-like protein n=1 Tax=Rhodococcoides fascians TaxID=1828 RepID=UPI00050C3439|nr:hypothetical protein [Rhodococcus fascians]